MGDSGTHSDIYRKRLKYSRLLSMVESEKIIIVRRMEKLKDDMNYLV